MSGEVTTTSGNTLINKCVTDFIFSRMRVPKKDYPSGDDGVIGCARINMQRLVAEYKRMGLLVKAQKVTISTMSYLSCNFYKDGQGEYTMLRDPYKALIKLPWCTKKCYSTGKYRQIYFLCKLLSMVHEYPGIKFFNELY